MVIGRNDPGSRGAITRHQRFAEPVDGLDPRSIGSTRIGGEDHTGGCCRDHLHEYDSHRHVGFLNGESATIGRRRRVPERSPYLTDGRQHRFGVAAVDVEQGSVLAGERRAVEIFDGGGGPYGNTSTAADLFGQLNDLLGQALFDGRSGERPVDHIGRCPLTFGNLARQSHQVGVGSYLEVGGGGHHTGPRYGEAGPGQLGQGPTLAPEADQLVVLVSTGADQQGRTRPGHR